MFAVWTASIFCPPPRSQNMALPPLPPNIADPHLPCLPRRQRPPVVQIQGGVSTGGHTGRPNVDLLRMVGHITGCACLHAWWATQLGVHLCMHVEHPLHMWPGPHAWPHYGACRTQNRQVMERNKRGQCSLCPLHGSPPSVVGPDVPLNILAPPTLPQDASPTMPDGAGGGECPRGHALLNQCARPRLPPHPLLCRCVGSHPCALSTTWPAGPACI